MTMTVAFTTTRTTTRTRTPTSRRTTPNKSMRSRTRPWASSQDIHTALDLARETNRGVNAGPLERERVERAVDEVVALNPTPSQNNSHASQGRWRLKYTTEKETLWLLGKGADVEAFQTIDNERATLVNEVIFGANSGGQPVIFRVDASTEIASPTRVNFKFVSASLTLSNGWRIPIPPVGAGWFDNIYVVDGIRVSRDSRGDTLVCERA